MAIARRFLYHVVRTRAEVVFLVGKRAVDVFAGHGWPRSKLVNLPVFVNVPAGREVAHFDRARIRSAYGIEPGEVLFVSGSRLEPSKGFDVLVEACGILKSSGAGRFRALVVGDGSEREGLGQKVKSVGLSDFVRFEQWMEPDAFERLIAACDVYVHPARFDPFGGGTLIAMSLGRPVVGSDCAGSALERIVDGWNGYLYDASSPHELAARLALFIQDPELAARLGEGARQTAVAWPPERGAQIVLRSIARGAT